jgi:hypothetical protein
MRYADQHCRCEEVYEPRHVYRYTGPCVQTGRLITVEVKAEELYAYRKGAYIQEALKSLSADDREFLLSGLSPEAWSDTFPDDDTGK